jgi:hypothetical protein
VRTWSAARRAVRTRSAASWAVATRVADRRRSAAGAV